MVGSTETKTIMDMLTDRDGKVEVKYIAGVVGLEEQIEAKATFENVDDMEERKASLTIKIEKLSPMPVIPQEYVLKGGTTLHPLGVNHFATTDMVFRVFNVARMFREFRTEFFGLTGVLKINDISLPLGGVFDLNGKLNDAGGHVSHEIGIDVDIESTDSNDVSIVPQRPFLKIIAKKALGCRKITDIHYRCDQPIPR